MTKGVFIKGWKLPKDCAACPFFHVNVANGGHGSFIRCRVDSRELPKSKTRELMLVRDNYCPLREVKDHEN